MKLTFEIEVDLPEGEPIRVIELKIQQGEEWSTPFAFVFGKPQRIRNGKHLQMTRDLCKVKAAGDIPSDLPVGIRASCLHCGMGIEYTADRMWKHIAGSPKHAATPKV